MGRMQLTFDVKHTGLVSGELNFLRLTAIHHLLNLEVRNGKAVVRRFRLDVIDYFNLHGVTLMNHVSRRNEYFGALVFDIDHGKFMNVISAHLRSEGSDAKRNHAKKHSPKSLPHLPHYDPPTVKMFSMSHNSWSFATQRNR